MEHALHVDVEHAVPRLGVLLGQRGAPVGAGVVHEDVEGVPPLGHRLPEAAAALLGGEVGHDVGAVALGGQLLG